MNSKPIQYDTPTVLWALRSLEPGGSETFCLDLIPNLASRLAGRLQLVLLLTARRGEFYDRALDAGIRMIEWDVRGKLNRRRVLDARDRLRALAPVLIHTHSFDTHFAMRAAAILAGCGPVVVHHHTMPARRYDPRLLNVERRLTPATDATLFVSRAARDQFVEMLGPRLHERDRARLHVVHDALDVTAMSEAADAADPRSLRAAYGFAPDTPVVGALARLHPVKNLELLIDSFAVLRRRLPAARCLIVGSGDPAYETALRRQALRLGLDGIVVFAGFRRDVAAHLKLFDVLTLTSHYEGLPRAIIEAYAVGCPVVVPRLPGIDEILRDGREGLLIEPGDPEALAAALHRLLADPTLRRRCAEAGRERSAEYHLDSYCNRLCNLYDELLRPADAIASVSGARRRYRWRHAILKSF